ncbi:deoxyribose-phosphate aldolase [Erysipelotrichaceae bacterium OttesenSCG-928-M19]|nr:deoxyribose-phosphate aldolase [Erysipelotrichaceae bacterium OttesenSCG-928-M19]
MELNKYIDHTLLKPEASARQIKQLCLQARENDFAAVCINPTWVKFCHDLLKDTTIKICTVIGFPLGANTCSTKVYETKDAIENGADEIDMVINIGALKEGNYDLVYNEIKEVREACQTRVLKVIIETCLLSEDEIIKACQLALQAKADFVKTSTGFSTAGAKVSDVKLMKSVVEDKMLIKASGGISSHEEMLALIAAGANRIGTSRGVDLIK